MPQKRNGKSVSNSFKKKYESNFDRDRFSAYVCLVFYLIEWIEGRSNDLAGSYYAILASFDTPSPDMLSP